MRQHDIISSLLLCLVGAAFAWGGFHLGFGALNAPGAGFIPVLIGGLLSLLSVVLLLITAAKHPAQPETGSRAAKTHWRNVVPALISLILYILLLNPLGYVVTTCFFLLYLLKFIGGKRWGASIAISVMASVASYLVFKVLLEVRLPAGMFHLG